MGTLYRGPYAGLIRDGDVLHEGAAARVLPDGSETGLWTHETREFTGYRAHCDCGWRGTTVYPPTSEGENQADDEWDRAHLQPLILAVAMKHTVPGTALLDFYDELQDAIGIRQRELPPADEPTTEQDGVARAQCEGAIVGLVQAARLLRTFIDSHADQEMSR